MTTIFPQWVKVNLSSTSTFKTHLNYIKCVDNLFDNCTITVRVRTNTKLDHKKIAKFESLTRITQQSIDNEVSLIAQQVEYTQVVAPWIPVKCYYRLYYLESIFLFLLNGDGSVFKQGGHNTVRKNLQIHLRDHAIKFNSIKLNRVVNLGDAMKYKGVAGSNIRSNYHLTDECIKAVHRKLSEYKESNWQEQNGIKNFMTKNARQKRSAFRQKQSITLIDYFYWMRIKANYKDIDFLDFDNISPTEAVEYIKHYVSAADKYANALNAAIIAIKKARSIEPIGTTYHQLRQ